ncbi:hypothetical protein KUCAC02_010819 [Chaenocephalus aceratus]|uniref:Uncharacterized protein n=1 Tax=Chaenocephalus aceratus TaxID=36190 RepID=A0ACB9WVH1_CHAAC|nr:hypothetical protein KUCAC02_010819 [Chaenocephalus aceratus]
MHSVMLRTDILASQDLNVEMYFDVSSASSGGRPSPTSPPPPLPGARCRGITFQQGVHSAPQMLPVDRCSPQATTWARPSLWCQSAQLAEAAVLLPLSDALCALWDGDRKANE